MKEEVDLVSVGAVKGAVSQAELSLGVPQLHRPFLFWFSI